MVVKQISDITYRIQHAHHPRKRMVVHFNRLKPFNGDVQETKKGNEPPVRSSETPSTQLSTSHTLTLCDDDDDDDDVGDDGVANAEPSSGSATQRYVPTSHPPCPCKI